MNYEIKDILERGDKQKIIETINNNLDLFDNNRIVYYIVNFDIKRVKIIFEHCEKINRKIDITDILSKFCVTYQLWKYILHLSKYNYYINVYKTPGYIIDAYCLSDDYSKTKYIRKYSQKNKKYKYIYNNTEIYVIVAFNIHILNYFMCVYWM